MGVGIIRSAGQAGYTPVCLSCRWPLPVVVPLRSHARVLLEEHHARNCTAPPPGGAA